MKSLDNRTKQITKEYAKFCMVQLLSVNKFGHREVDSIELKVIDEILDNMDNVDLNKLLEP